MGKKKSFHYIHACSSRKDLKLNFDNFVQYHFLNIAGTAAQTLKIISDLKICQEYHVRHVSDALITPGEVTTPDSRFLPADVDYF